MGMVKAKDLKAGMLLAEPLRDLSGRTLLKEGAELTEQYIDRIRKWGFTEVSVQGAGEAPPPPPVIGYRVKGRPWEEIAAEIDGRFSQSAADPTLLRLKVAVVRRVREIARIHAGS